MIQHTQTHTKLEAQLVLIFLQEKGFFFFIEFLCEMLNFFVSVGFIIVFV